MKQLELVIDDRVIDIPEEMTLGIYQNLMKNPNYLENKPFILSTFTGIPQNEIKNLEVDTIQLIETFCSTRLQMPTSNELIVTFKFDGVEYGLENNWGKMAWGAWIDLEVYSTDNINQNLHKIMAILYRPIVSRKNGKYTIEKYNSETIEERAELFKELPLKYWTGAADFFFSIVQIYIKNMESSLVLMEKMNKPLLMIWKKLPKKVQQWLPLGSILHLPYNLRKTTLQK
jgi:hypothetical protein